jgi:hypothetical protein
MNATERHATLIDAGWSVRLDGKWRPPAEWDDRRAYTPLPQHGTCARRIPRKILVMILVFPAWVIADPPNSPHTHILDHGG